MYLAGVFAGLQLAWYCVLLKNTPLPLRGVTLEFVVNVLGNSLDLNSLKNTVSPSASFI
jgi:hypothetical protein